MSAQYGWGKIGGASQVAQLAAADDTFHVDATQPYAELWMGTHPKGPSLMTDSGVLLADWLADHVETLGEGILVEEGMPVQLPFLFKVLSVNKALSIQSHPTKEQAVILHANDPSNYPDANHKPEMAIALTPFEMLCGFRTPDEILINLKETPELFELVGGPAFTLLSTAIESKVDARPALRECFTNLMNQPATLLSKNLSSLVQRIALHVRSSSDSTYDSTTNGSGFVLGELIVRLNYHFPGDIGCFAPFFLNHFVLQPGEASFLAPNEPHAYLFGDCMECMACSDNTIRAGLTPKFKDVATLCSSLTYRMSTAESNKFASRPLDECTIEYAPNTDEFAVHKIEIPPLVTSHPLATLSTCSLLIVIDGQLDAHWSTGEESTNQQTMHMCKGVVVFVAANQAVDFSKAVVDGDEERKTFIAYRAYRPVN